MEFICIVEKFLLCFADVNECERPDLNECVYGCTNTNGNYVCPCFWGQRGDGKKTGTGCKYSGGTIFAGKYMKLVFTLH